MQPVLGDILSDLPEISSFTMAESADYRTEPQTPFQHFLRRSPPDFESPLKIRAATADGFMKSCQDIQRKKITQARRDHDGVQQVGQHSFIFCIFYKRCI